MAIVTEHGATIAAQLPKAVSRSMGVFYNPVMKKNRDLSVLLLLARGRMGLRICDPLAGSGVRSIRFLKELPAGMVKELLVNDLKEGFARSFRQNLRLSGFGKVPEGVSVREGEANTALMEGPSFDYVDIDPFGSPNPFLDAACKRVRREGVLAVTATDTAPLCGTYPKACARKYWARPRRDYLMHEWGLRILIRKCQLVAAQYDKALVPLFACSLNHYFRVFFEVQQGKKKVDEVLARHELPDGYGPLWTGPLWDASLVERMVEENGFEEHSKLLQTILEESRVEAVGFHDVHELARELKLAGPPRHDELLKRVRREGFAASRTHFSGTGLRTRMEKARLQTLIKEAFKKDC